MLSGGSSSLHSPPLLSPPLPSPSPSPQRWQGDRDRLVLRSGGKEMEMGRRKWKEFITHIPIFISVQKEGRWWDRRLSDRDKLELAYCEEWEWDTWRITKHHGKWTDVMPTHPTKECVCDFSNGPDMEWKGGQQHCAQLGIHWVCVTDTSKSHLKWNSQRWILKSCKHTANS